MELVLVGAQYIAIHHRGEEILFPISGTNSFEKTAIVKIVADEKKNPYNPFKDINDVIKSLSKEKQKELFNQFIMVNDTLNEVYSFEKLKEFLTGIFKTIYSIVTVEYVLEYMIKYSVIHIPTDIEENDATRYKEERTYTVEKYKGLMSLCIALKLALPIWGAYVKFITKGTGVGRKEIHCTSLLKESSIINSVQYNEFVDFVVFTYNAGKNKTNSVLSGFGTEEQTILFPAACLVRKISVAPNLKSESVVKVVFTYILNEGPGNERRHSYIRDKKIDKTAMFEERALLEIYQVNESISPGDIEAITAYCENIPLILSHLCPDMDERYIAETIKLRDYLIEKEYEPNLMNIRLVQFFIKGVPPQIVQNLDSKDIVDLYRHSLAERKRRIRSMITGIRKDDIIDEERITKLKKELSDLNKVNPEDIQTHAKLSLLAILFTTLIYKGYPSIALLVTAKRIESDGIDATIGNSRKQIPADIDSALDELYPLRISGGKDTINMVKEAIAKFFNQFSSQSYRSVYTPFFKKSVEGIEDREGNHYLRPETPINLAKITLDIYGDNNA